MAQQGHLSEYDNHIVSNPISDASPPLRLLPLLERRYPFAGQPLCLRNLGGGHSVNEVIAVTYGFTAFPAGRVVRGREVEPLVRLHIVLLNAVAVAVHHTEVIQGFGEAFLGGQPPPLHRLRVVLPHGPAFVVHQAEVELRQGVALLGGFPGGVKAGFEEEAGDSG